jgi:hypothetical protein
MGLKRKFSFSYFRGNFLSFSRKKHTKSSENFRFRGSFRKSFFFRESFRENFRFRKRFRENFWFRENFLFGMRIRIQEPLECVSRGL